MNSIRSFNMRHSCGLLVPPALRQIGLIGGRQLRTLFESGPIHSRLVVLTQLLDVLNVVVLR